MAHIKPALLEYWLRDYYFNAKYDLSGSGVEDFSVRQLNELIGLDLNNFNDLYFHDSPVFGSDALRTAIGTHYNQPASSVMVGNGSSEVIFLLMHALLDAGDEVIVVDPCYPALRQVADSIGCKVHDWTLDANYQFEPDLNKLAELINDNTKAVVINFPHNPTGVSLTHQQQLDLVALLQEKDIYLIWDAVFIDMQYNKPLQDFHQLYDKTISLGTLSKSYGLPGMRVGWAFAPQEVLEKSMHWRDYTTICLSPLIEGIATHVIENADVLIKLRREQAQKNINIAKQWARQHNDAIDWQSPQGGVSTFPQFKQMDDTYDFCKKLIHEEGVLLAPGSCFGYPKHVRLGLGGSSEKLEIGLSLISKKLKG